MDQEMNDIQFKRWSKELGILTFGYSPELFRKLLSKERRHIWQRVVRYVRPSQEVEHIRKNLAIEKLKYQIQLKREMDEKETEIQIQENDFSQTYQELQVLNFERQRVMQRTKELNRKSLLLHYKEQDLLNKVLMYKNLLQIPGLQSMDKTFSGKVNSVCNEDLKIIYQNVIEKCEKIVCEVHLFCKSKDITEQELHDKKKSLKICVRQHTENIPALSIYLILVELLEGVIKELLNLIQYSVGKMSGHSHKQLIKSKLNKYMKSYLRLIKRYTNLQQTTNVIKKDYETHFVKILDMIEKQHNKSQECSEIRKWLLLETDLIYLSTTKDFLQSELTIMKTKYSKFESSNLNSQEDESLKLQKQIKLLETNINTNYTWFISSYNRQSKEQEKMSQQISKISTKVLDKCDKAALDISLKRLKGAFKEELKLFKEIPLHALRGPSTLNAPILQYIPFLEQMMKHNDITQILKVLDGAPSVAPHLIILNILEKKFYYNSLRLIQVDNSFSASLADLDVSSLKQVENATSTIVNETMNSLKKSIEDSKTIARRAHYNLETCFKYPLGNAIPENLIIEHKCFKQWKKEYDNLVIDLLIE